MAQQIEKLPRKLEFKFAFGSIVIGVPDELRRAGCSGARIAWLYPGEEALGLHAEGAALTRQGDAQEILERWELLASRLQGVESSSDPRTTLLAQVSELERFILARATPAEGFSTLFDLARSAAAVHRKEELPDSHSLPFAVGALTWLLELAGKYKDDRASTCAPDVLHAWEYQLREASMVIGLVGQLGDVDGTCTVHQGVISLPDGSTLRLRDPIFGTGPEKEMTKHVQIPSSIETEALLHELRRRGFIVSAWGLDDTNGPLENDDATEGLEDNQFVRLQEKLFEKAAVSLEDVLTTRGNQHVADIWDMQRCRMLEEVRGEQAEPQARSLGT